VENVKKLQEFLKESWQEVRYKVTWPAKDEVWGTTQVVLVAVVVFAVLVAVMDWALYWFVDSVFNLLS